MLNNNIFGSRSFFAQTHLENRKASADDTIKAVAEEDFLIRNSINKTWNEEVAAERVLRLQKERAMRMQVILKKVDMKAERDMLIQERVDTEIIKAKEESVTFITRDNIDEAIELVLRDVVCHNVAIDVDGNNYPKNSQQVTGTS